MRVMYKWAEASAPARGDDHMSSDVVQSVLHLSSACAGKAHTPQLRAAGQTTGVGPGITDVLWGCASVCRERARRGCRALHTDAGT